MSFAPTYSLWSVSQASRMRPKSAPEEEGVGVVAAALPKAGTATLPTPIPTQNATANASPMTAPRSLRPRPRPAAGETDAWEVPVVREVTPGGSDSVVGAAWIGSGSMVGIVLVRGWHSTRSQPADRHRTDRPARPA